MLHPLLELTPIDDSVFPGVCSLTTATAFEVLTDVVIAISKLLLALTVLQEIFELAAVYGS